MSSESPEQAATPTPLNKENLKREASVIEYVNAAASTSSHARNVIIVLIVATVLVAIEMRNTSYSWIDARQEVRAAALKFFDENPEQRELLAKNDPELYRRAGLFLERNGLSPTRMDDKTHIEKELDLYRQAAIEEISLFHIPFFGAVFDHNDLGMFAGFTFSVLLLWFRYSLSRELGNLNLLFNHPDFANERRRCYELLAMQQVLTVPRLQYSPLQYRWRSLPKILYFIPIPVYAGQMYFDFNSIFRVGQILGMGKAWLLITTSILFMTLIIILSVWCFKILLKIDETWDKAAANVYPENFGLPRVR